MTHHIATRMPRPPPLIARPCRSRDPAGAGIRDIDVVLGASHAGREREIRWGRAATDPRSRVREHGAPSRREPFVHPERSGWKVAPIDLEGPTPHRKQAELFSEGMDKKHDHERLGAAPTVIPPSDPPSPSGSATAPDEPPRLRYEPDTRLGDFVVEEFIAEGGFGSVYRARHPRFRTVALKVSHLPANKLSVERLALLQNELEALIQLGHPSLVRVLDHGTLDDHRSYLALELVEGESLLHYMERRGRGRRARGNLADAPPRRGDRALPRAQDRPPRPDPDQRHRRRRLRAGPQDRRLRRRRVRRGLARHRAPSGRRHAAVHGARARPRAAADRRPLRRLRPRPDLLRAPHRAVPVRRLEHVGPVRQEGGRRHAAGHRPRPRAARGGGRGRPRRCSSPIPRGAASPRPRSPSSSSSSTSTSSVASTAAAGARRSRPRTRPPPTSTRRRWRWSDAIASSPRCWPARSRR